MYTVVKSVDQLLLKPGLRIGLENLTFYFKVMTR